MQEVFGVFALPSWVMWLLNHPYLFLFAGICIALLYINFKAKLEQQQFTMSKEVANYIVIAVIALIILIIKL